MTQYSWIFWLAAVIFFVIVEAATFNLVSIWFVGGTLAALLADLLGAGIGLQITLFFVVSAILLACLRPLARKQAAVHHIPTNADMVLGRSAYLTEAVDNLRGTGALKMDGKEWTVRSLTGAELPKGTLVTVVKLDGVKLLVEPAEVTAGV